MKKREKQHTCEKCKKTFYTKSRYQRFCFECFEKHDKEKLKLKELKGGNNQMAKQDKGGKKPQFNKSNCKKFLAQSGLHVKPDAVEKFKKLVEEFAVTKAAEIAEKTKARNSKTIAKEDVA